MQTEAQKRASAKYRKKHFRRVSLDFQNSYYESCLKEYAKEAGETVSGYIKKAIEQRAERERK